MSSKDDHGLEKLQLVRPLKRDFKMLTNTTFVEFYLHNVFEDYTADLISHFTTDGALFIDIGAHHGFYSLVIANKNKNSKIIAFEPVPESYEILKKNMELAKLTNFELCNLAVSNKNGKRAFNVADRSSRSGFYHSPVAKTVKKIKVQTIALDSFIKEISAVPVVIKIDTEGHELCILDGMTNLLKKTKDIRLFVEFNRDLLKSAGYEPGELLYKIDHLGFDIYLIDDELKKTYKQTKANFKNWESFFGQDNYQKNYFNLLCIKKEKSLNICFFSHSADLYGAERRLLELVTELIHDHGVVCTVILPTNGPLKTRLEAVGASTAVINYSHWSDSGPVSEEERESRLANSLRNIVNYTTQTLSKINPDIIFTQTMVIPWGALAASILGKPHVWGVCEFGILDHGENFFQPFELTVDFIRQSSNIILTNSKIVKDTLFTFESNKKVQTIYSYANIPSNALSQDKKKYFTRIKATKLVISGTVNVGKGQKDAVLAVKELIKRGHDIELIIMGNNNTEYARHLETIIKNSKLEPYIKFIGFKANPYPIMNQADIALMCSRNEAFGRVTLEAMLLKKPVIATNSGSSPELITDKYNGLLYSPEKYKQLADKIQYFIEHKEQINKFGKNGYQFAKKTFTKEKFGGRAYKLLKGIKNEANLLSSPYSHFMMRLASSALSELQEKDAKISNLEESLQQFNNRIVIRLANKYHKIIEKLLRSGTIRRKYYEKIYAGFRIILNEGWRGLWLKKKNT